MEVEEAGITVMQKVQQGDDSSLFLLFGVTSMIIIGGFILIWKANVKSAYLAQYAVERGRKPTTIFKDLSSLFDSKLHNTMLFIPLIGIMAFTITPLIYMILAAFTNYDKNHNGIAARFHWIGLKNFTEVLGGGNTYGNTFWKILGWTFVWAIFATFLCYLGGMLLALLINRKGIKYKSLWRTVFVMSVAIPQFVTLLTMRMFLQRNGILDGLLGRAENTSLDLLGGVMSARVTVIVVNCWVGIPYTMLIMTGILMNIPADLYESAKIDGANKTEMFFKITLPYMIFVTTPHLIQQFVGNINNFNVIYLLTGGGPDLEMMYEAGSTDLLVTWLYKLTLSKGDYCFASAIGICIFIISATFSLITYRRSGSYKNEEEFQ
jgi:arabinogalactan oligomer/maltooligosaccharide transport system permease protein